MNKLILFILSLHPDSNCHKHNIKSCR